MEGSTLEINELEGNSSKLVNLNNINIILGKNGSGKSKLLREIENKKNIEPQTFSCRYISPERSGVFLPDRDTSTVVNRSNNIFRNDRDRNQVGNFKNTSALLLLELEKVYLRRMEATPAIRKDETRTFANDRLSKINQLLTNVSIDIGNSGITFHSKIGNLNIYPTNLSSGESEIVSLATEILYFFETLNREKCNVLFLDEPDVHLHPDLQARLGKLLIDMLEENSDLKDNIIICIATHSSSLACSLASSPYVSIGSKSFDSETVEFKPISSELRRIAPFFGHPLSLCLSDDAPLILEGADDESVWQQAVRMSQDKVKVFPIVAGGVDRLKKLEGVCIKLLKALYDEPVAFSIRDGDNKGNQKLQHKLPLKRFRLQCYAVENLLVTDPCLSIMGTTWDDFVASALKWIGENSEHKSIDFMQQLIGSAVRLRHNKIKDLRHIICEIAGCKKPWEAVVGKAIAQLRREDVDTPNMLVDFLGKDLVDRVIFRGARQQESPMTPADDTEQSLASVDQ